MDTITSRYPYVPLDYRVELPARTLIKPLTHNDTLLPFPLLGEVFMGIAAANVSRV
jgi:hypothetical protein